MTDQSTPLDESTPAEDVAATFCATLVDQWVAAGVTDAVVSPGSRSTPMALALAADDRIAVHVHHDERSAGFTALGLGLASDRPALVLTTSGTAAVELHPAVVEAHQAAVPMIVLTADRPPELQGVGAPQTIDQVQLYGRATPWFVDAGVPEVEGASGWRMLADRAHGAACGTDTGRPGPVHLNLPFCEPLVGRPSDLPPRVPSPDTGPAPRRSSGPLAAGVRRLLTASRGLIVAGDRNQPTELVARCAEASGWPVLSSPQANLEGDTIQRFDAVLRHDGVARALVPDVVLQLGGPPASKVLAQWLERNRVPVVAVDTRGRPFDPAGLVVGASTDLAAVVALVEQAGRAVNSPWASSWSRAEASARRAIDQAIERVATISEPRVARDASRCANVDLVVSSSMPIRDIEWYGDRNGRTWSNRGANGIDGVVSTAVGIALSGRAVVAYVGDVAFLHDSNALLGIAERGIDLTIVVVDNDGGGIFSFLPQAEALDTERFEQLYGTPHGVDLRVLAAAHGLMTIEPAVASEVGPAIQASIAAGGVRLVLVKTDRAANVAVHDQIHAAVAAALDDLDLDVVEPLDLD